jgi:regulator of sirC expression with transglutaminase-like and TPR domain
MKPPAIKRPKKRLSQGQRAALINLLTDEDPAIYHTVRREILSCGDSADEWVRPHMLSGNPVLRRRAQEIVRNLERQRADNRFLAFCLKHGQEFDLEHGAWLLAQSEFPEINVEAYQALLDSYAAEMYERIGSGGPAKQILGVMNEYLFGKLGFRGNEQNYYDPENSYLNRVIDRRSGNPINLCLVYILIGRRLRLPLTGIGLPGHFICRYQSSSDELYIDVFNRGRFLTKADCIQYLLQGNYSLRDDYLAPISARRLLLRVCGNLHQIYVRLELAEETTRLQRYLVALSR